MERNLIRIKNQILLFLLGTFTITFSMGIVMFIVYKYGDKTNLSTFATVQMLYPALVAIILIIKYEKNSIHKSLFNFFRLYIVLCIASIINLIIGVLFFQKYILYTVVILIAVFTVIAFVLIIKNKDNCFQKINMVFQNNFKSSAFCYLIFIGIEIILLFINEFNYNFIEALRKSFYILSSLPLGLLQNIGLSFIIFFGEELGWRLYLQPKLQVLFGKKLGVIILGIIWGLWHLPLSLMLYSPQTPIYCIINQIFFCIFFGVFLGFVYMKTKNLWAIIFIHCTNNLIGFNSNGNVYNAIFSPKTLILNIIIWGIVFLPFIFTKEYKENSY